MDQRCKEFRLQRNDQCDQNPTYCRLDGLLFGVLLAAFKAFKPNQWRRYADPRWALVVGLAALVLAGSLFHYPSAPGFRGPR